MKFATFWSRRTSRIHSFTKVKPWFWQNLLFNKILQKCGFRTIFGSKTWKARNGKRNREPSSNREKIKEMSSEIYRKFIQDPPQIHPKTIQNSWKITSGKVLEPSRRQKSIISHKNTEKRAPKLAKGPPRLPKGTPRGTPKSPKIMKKAMQKYINFWTPSRTLKKTSFSLKIDKKTDGIPL